MCGVNAASHENSAPSRVPHPLRWLEFFILIVNIPLALLAVLAFDPPPSLRQTGMGFFLPLSLFGVYLAVCIREESWYRLRFLLVPVFVVGLLGLYTLADIIAEIVSRSTLARLVPNLLWVPLIAPITILGICKMYRFARLLLLNRAA